MANPQCHLPEEIAQNPERVVVNTRHGPITGGRASTGVAVFLEVPYALPPGRFEDPVPLPNDFTYENKEYIYETAYGVQPTNDGQAQSACPQLSREKDHEVLLDTPFEDKVGLGRPSENPLFLNIVSPPSFPAQGNFPVKIYIHGGFLQFGSPHTLGSQAQYVAAERSTVYVNIGYRLSAFGFLASDKPRLQGNYGFKDQWLALEWIKENIDAFGGNPDDIQVTGLSAGAHSVHQLLHRASHLPEGQKAPFSSAALQSNAILTNPKTLKESQVQFEALCRALHLDPDDPDVLITLRDPVKVPWPTITHVIETDVLGPNGTFRGCLADDWLSTFPDPMAWQKSGGLARGLLAHGVKSVVVGDLSEEWYLYSIAHPISSPRDIVPNLTRYIPQDVAERFVKVFRKIPDDAGPEESEKLFGEILSCGQVHLPIRVLVQDLSDAGFPVLRYAVEWTPEQLRTGGYVTHGSDRCLWALRLPILEPQQADIAREWLKRIEEEERRLEKGSSQHIRRVLTLSSHASIAWKLDPHWEAHTRLRRLVLKETNEYELDEGSK